MSENIVIDFIYDKTMEGCMKLLKFIFWLIIALLTIIILIFDGISSITKSSVNRN